MYSQTFKDFEIILVNDGSKDNLHEVLQQLLSESLHVIDQENGGVSVARNAGILNAKGEYICFLDADDIWLENHLAVLNELIDKYSNSNVFVTSHITVTQSGKNIHSSNNLKDYPLDFETDNFIGLLNATAYSVVHTNSVCAKRELFVNEKIMFEPNVKIGEDTDVWYRLSLKQKVAVSKQETTTYMREYSTATKHTSNVVDWVFAARKQDVLSDPGISDLTKESVIELVDRYKLTCSREYMIEKKRKQARSILACISNKSGKRYYITLLLTYMPFFVCRALLKKELTLGK